LCFAGLLACPKKSASTQKISGVPRVLSVLQAFLYHNVSSTSFPAPVLRLVLLLLLLESQEALRPTPSCPRCTLQQPGRRSPNCSLAYQGLSEKSSSSENESACPTTDSPVRWFKTPGVLERVRTAIGPSPARAESGRLVVLKTDRAVPDMAAGVAASPGNVADGL